jgi:hypothetical protein
MKLGRTASWQMKKKAPAQKAPAPKKAKAETPPPWSALYKAMVLRGEIKE